MRLKLPCNTTNITSLALSHVLLLSVFSVSACSRITNFAVYGPFFFLSKGVKFHLASHG